MERVTTDIRIIAATNRDLFAMVEKGEFRCDLFYRINIIRLHLPPLRERMEDIPLLIERCIQKMNHLRGRAVSQVGTDAVTLLLRHDYPGNISDLENIIEHALFSAMRGRSMFRICRRIFQGIKGSNLLATLPCQTALGLRRKSYFLRLFADTITTVWRLLQPSASIKAPCFVS